MWPSKTLQAWAARASQVGRPRAKPKSATEGCPRERCPAWAANARVLQAGAPAMKNMFDPDRFRAQHQVAVAGEDRGRTRRALEVRVTAKSELAGGGAMMISDIDAPDNKQWLERTAQAQGVPMARLVREAVRRMRQQEKVSPEELLRQTSGLWRRGDGLGRRSSGHVPA